eukprot:SAG11_NODE_36164_length_263_cov_0.621951_1_plen_27_part_10
MTMVETIMAGEWAPRMTPLGDRGGDA